MREALRGYIRDSILGSPQTGIADVEDLLLSGLVDSVGIMRLIGWMETTFSIAIPPEDVTIENFGTIADMAGYIERRRSAAGSTG